ncbi:MAG: hypothetical protein RQ866_09435 [Bacteroidales bacterium]|nr:hypothetical protein [Bacteroidales bacterium]
MNKPCSNGVRARAMTRRNNSLTLDVAQLSEKPILTPSNSKANAVFCPINKRSGINATQPDSLIHDRNSKQPEMMAIMEPSNREAGNLVSMRSKNDVVLF